MEIKAPYGCVVFQHCCSEGQEVVEGSDVISIEAMKLETILTAPCSGRVVWLRPMGESAEEGECLARVES